MVTVFIQVIGIVALAVTVSAACGLLAMILSILFTKLTGE